MTNKVLSEDKTEAGLILTLAVPVTSASRVSVRFDVGQVIDVAIEETDYNRLVAKGVDRLEIRNV